MRRSLKKYLPWIGATLTTIFLIIFFHACSDVKLTHGTSASVQDIKQARTSGNFCIGNPSLTFDSLKIVFVVDMSYSNIGSTGPGTTATDPNVGSTVGQRFQLIRNFVNMPCVATNPNNKFAVIGFSTSTFALGGNCDFNQFQPATNPNGTLNTGLNNEISNLETIQTNDQALGINSVNMLDTHYLNGLGCADTIISTDLSNMPSTQRQNQAYLVFFLTDGMPNDPAWGGNTLNINLAKSGIDTEVAQILANQGPGGASSVQVEPIEYGIGDITPAEVNTANTVLTEMGVAGGGYGFYQITNASQIPLCTLLGSTRTNHFDVLSFGVINLTAKMVQGVLLPDSDMDGLTDDVEVSLGFNPQNPRSSSGTYGSRLLDGFCPKGMPASSCQPAAVPCSKPNAIGVTDCDVASQNAPNADGLDSNRDGLPDIVKIVKGASMNTNDTNSNTDGDSLSLMAEILLGRDPFSWDDDLDSKFLIKYVNYQSAATPTCTLDQQPYTFQVQNIPLVQTLSMRLNPANTANFVPDLVHDTNENVIFIYYIEGQSLSGANVTTPSILMGQFIKVSYDDQIVHVGAFKNLGNINGIYSPWCTPTIGGVMGSDPTNQSCCQSAADQANSPACQ